MISVVLREKIPGKCYRLSCDRGPSHALLVRVKGEEALRLLFVCNYHAVQITKYQNFNHNRTSRLAHAGKSVIEE